MRWPSLKYFGGLCMFLLSKDLKIDKDVAFFISVGRLFQARIVDGKYESRKRFVFVL